MKALIVSDIHSNLEAFGSVINDAEARGGFDEVWSLGDLVGYGPDPGAVIDLLRQFKHSAVVGNHDLASIEQLSLEAFNSHAKEANIWTAGRLTNEQKDYIDLQPIKLELGEFSLVHGSPRDPIWEYVVSNSAAVASFNYFHTYRCLVGHSHIPFVCRPTGDDATEFRAPTLDRALPLNDDRLIINPGGVGQPRDGDPRASYAVYDSVDETVTHHRTEYDIPKTQEKMRQYGLSEFLIDRLAHGR